MTPTKSDAPVKGSYGLIERQATGFEDAAGQVRTLFGQSGRSGAMCMCHKYVTVMVFGDRYRHDRWSGRRFRACGEIVTLKASVTVMG